MATKPEKTNYKRICVTGASGYLGSHVVDQLLARGYDVVACVRDKDAPKNKFLHDLLSKHSETSCSLKIVSADLNAAGSHDAAIAGCDVVVHVATVVKDNYEKDPYQEIINPAVEGTRDIIKSCTTHGVKRIVATSSMGILVDFKRAADGPAFTEEDNATNLSPTHGTYAYSKVMAEKVLKEEWKGELVTILPSMILGPVFDASTKSSIQLVAGIINREFPAAPPMYFDWIDVRDAARAHIEVGVESTSATGRYIISNNKPSFVIDHMRLAAEDFPQLKIRKRAMPWGLLWFASFFDKRITNVFLYDVCKKLPGASPKKICTEQGFVLEFTDPRVTMRATVQSLIDVGAVGSSKKK
eukprot:PhM_4_TR15725/c0_g1_i1/m.88228